MLNDRVTQKIIFNGWGICFALQAVVGMIKIRVQNGYRPSKTISEKPKKPVNALQQKEVPV